MPVSRMLAACFGRRPTFGARGLPRWFGSSSHPSLHRTARVGGPTVDYLYHLGLNSADHDIKAMFGDVRYVLMVRNLCAEGPGLRSCLMVPSVLQGGSAVRAAEVARLVQQLLDVRPPTGMDLAPIGKTERFSMYKVGPVLSVSHGMGEPSLSILLHEITKMLVNHADISPRDLAYVRLGTCGGIGVDPGTVVVASGAVNGAFEPFHDAIVLGERIRMPCSYDNNLCNMALACADTVSAWTTPAIPDAAAALQATGDDGSAIPAVIGTTMSAQGFYLEQGRLDGFFGGYSEEQAMAWLQRGHDAGGACCNVV